MKCTRREWLGLGLGAGAAVFGGRWNLSFAGEKTDSGPVNMAVIPSSGEQVPAVGLGTVKFQGNPDSDDLSQLRQTLQTFHRLGGRVLDTSGEPLPGLYAVGEAAGFGGGGASGKRSLEGTFLSGCILTARKAAAAIKAGS